MKTRFKQLHDAPLWALMRGRKGVVSKGFSLIEILVVISLIALLAGLLVAAAEGLRGGTERRRAEAEMAVITSALEQYRAHFGDYPSIRSAEVGHHDLYAALIGQMAPDGRFFSQKQRHFSEPGALRVGGKVSGSAIYNEVLPQPQIVNGKVLSFDTSFAQHAFIDPWNRPYRYFYKVRSSPANWLSAGYVLLTTGALAEEDPDPSTADFGEAATSGLLPPDYFSKNELRARFLSPSQP